MDRLGESLCSACYKPSVNVRYVLFAQEQDCPIERTSCGVERFVEERARVAAHNDRCPDYCPMGRGTINLQLALGRNLRFVF